jgi:hypothetical protein
LSVGFISFGIAIVLKSEISGMSIVGSALFIWIGSGMLSLVLNYFKTIEINTEYITIKTHFGLITKRYRFEDIAALNSKPFKNQWASYPGLLIRFRNKKQVHIHAHEYENFHEIRKAITDRINRYEEMEIKVWTPALTGIMIAGALILVGLAIVKLFQL